MPWARPGSGFTLLFEALVVEFSVHMPVKAIERLAGENDAGIWRVLERYVARARAELDFSEVTEIGVDEASARRGQDYVTIFMELSETPRVLYATEGRGADTVGSELARVQLGLLGEDGDALLLAAPPARAAGR